MELNHNVLQVSAGDYESCSGITNTRGVKGPFRFCPIKQGIYYFVSGVGKHCKVGKQKAKITVSDNCDAGTTTETPGITQRCKRCLSPWIYNFHRQHYLFVYFPMGGLHTEGLILSQFPLIPSLEAVILWVFPVWMDSQPCVIMSGGVKKC